MLLHSIYIALIRVSPVITMLRMAQEIVLCSFTCFVVGVGYYPRFYRLSAVSPSDRWFPLSHCFAFLPAFAMSTPPAPPAPGGNATAALALASAMQPEEMVIHSGAATTEGDMSYLEDDFDPCRNDPSRNMPGVLDSNIDTINFNNIDQRTAQVAVVQQGVDPTLASQFMAAQQQALQSEANALHSEVMERQRDALVSEARDQLASIEQRAADEIYKKNLYFC